MAKQYVHVGGGQGRGLRMYVQYSKVLKMTISIMSKGMKEERVLHRCQTFLW